MEALPDGLRGTIERSNVDRLDILNIVTACLSYGGVDALDTLLGYVRWGAPDSEPVRRLNELAAELGIAPPVVPRDRLDALSRASDGLALSPESLRRALSELPSRVLSATGGRGGSAATLGAIAVDLGRLGPRAGGTLPLLELVERLAWDPDLAPAAAAALRGWVDETAAACGRPPAEVEALRRRLASEAAAARSAYLLVSVAGVPNEDGRYELRASIWRGRAAERPAGVHHRSLDLAGVKAEVRELVLRAANEHGVALRDLTVEFLLPDDLLAADVDQWTIRVGRARERRIGTEHPVVVRSLTRAAEAALVEELRFRVGALARDPTARPGRNVLVVDPSAVDDEWVYDCVSNQREIVCVVVPEPLPPSPRGAPLHVAGALDAGAPAILWLRRAPTDPAAAQRDVDELFAAAAQLSSLPQRLQERRRGTPEDDVCAYGNVLSLVWDDPERIPESLRPLTVPPTRTTP